MLHNIRHLAVLSIFLATCISGLSQTNAINTEYEIFDAKYGLDQKLFNGYKYYPKHTNVLGHPFLDLGRKTPQGSAYSGKVFYNDNLFSSIKLKYDVFQQQIVLVSKDSYGANQLIVLPIAEQDSCWIKERLFLKGSLFNSKYNIVEVVQEGNESILIEQYKEYKPTGSSSGYTHTYTKLKKNIYLYKNDDLVWLRNNKVFIKAYPIEIQANLKNYIRKNKVKIKKAGTNELKDLLYFTNDLIQQL